MIRGFDNFLSRSMGATKASKVWLEAEVELKHLVSKADFRGHKAIKTHKTKYILPVVAVYKVLQNHGLSKEKAKDLIEEYLFFKTEKIAKKCRIIGKLPFFYSLFMVIFNKVMDKGYPKEGWIIGDVILGDVIQGEDSAAFNMKSCLYVETLSELQCSELTPMFCHTDVIMYENMSPYLNFQRTKTLAGGFDCCDFKFSRGINP